MLASAVASAEQVGPVGILRRSWDLSHGNWWRLFVFLLLFFVGALCLVWAVETVFALLARVLFADSGPLSARRAADRDRHASSSAPSFRSFSS